MAVLLNEPERAPILAATRAVRLLAPASLPWEVGNALIALRRRRQIEMDQAKMAWKNFERVPIRLLQIDTLAALRLADAHQLYAYDAYMVQAALGVRCPLLTLDKRLYRAAGSAGITLQEVDV